LLSTQIDCKAKRFFEFNSQVKDVGPIDDWSQDAVKKEQMLFNCDLAAAFEMGGQITRNVILNSIKYKHPATYNAVVGLNAVDRHAYAAVALKKLNAVIDTRVHMLKKGWYPCIPGFHHDDVPRSRTDGQPNYCNPEYKAVHHMALVNGDIAPTEFAIGDMRLPDVDTGEVYYKKWHPIVEDMISKGKLTRIKVPSNRILEFDWTAMHQGVGAVADGWRWFGRITYGSNRVPTNEIRHQVQVYMEHPMEGW
jgi:hypothetical protein